MASSQDANTRVRGRSERATNHHHEPRLPRCSSAAPADEVQSPIAIELTGRLDLLNRNPFSRLLVGRTNCQLSGSCRPAGVDILPRAFCPVAAARPCAFDSCPPDPYARNAVFRDLRCGKSPVTRPAACDASRVRPVRWFVSRPRPVRRIVPVGRGDCHDAALLRSDLPEPRHGASSRVCGTPGEHYGAPGRRRARRSAASARRGNRPIEPRWAGCIIWGMWTVWSGLPRGGRVHRTGHGGQPGLVSGGHFGGRGGRRCDPTRRARRGFSGVVPGPTARASRGASSRRWGSACSTTSRSRPGRRPPSWSSDRVLIVDWDVHHCNGTQAAFWEDEQVGVFSIHRSPFYPGTGDEDETGAGKGLGTTRNLADSLRHAATRVHVTVRPRTGVVRRPDPAPVGADQRRVRYARSGPGRLPGSGGRGLRDADQHRAGRGGPVCRGDAWSARWKVATTCTSCRDRSRRIWRRCLPVRQANVRTTRPDERAGIRRRRRCAATSWRSE